MFQAIIADREGFACEDLAVFCAGKPLENEMNLSSFQDLATLEVEVRMLGGKFFAWHDLTPYNVLIRLTKKRWKLKFQYCCMPCFCFFVIWELAHNDHFYFHALGKVHGSLARAGKVRGQTPKVRASLYRLLVSLCMLIQLSVLTINPFLISSYLLVHCRFSCSFKSCSYVLLKSAFWQNVGKQLLKYSFAAYHRIQHAKFISFLTIAFKCFL